MVTIRDVARLSNVSVGTVSNVYNKPELVNPDTISKVKEISEKLGYFPSRIARGLASSRTQLIGLVVSNIHNSLYSQIAKSVEATLKPYGYNIMLINTDYSMESEKESVKILLQAKVDGVIYGSTYSEMNSEHLNEFIKREIPAVVINRSLDATFDQIIWDTVGGSFDATNYLFSLGHKKIGFIGKPLNSSETTSLRFEGFYEAHERKGQLLNMDYVIFGNEMSYDEGFRLMNQFLSNRYVSSNFPTAFFVAQDDMAIGAISAIASKGLSVPGDISIMGFANHFYSKFCSPPLSTVDIPCIDAGKLASEILIKRLAAPDLKKERIILPCNVIIRQSTASREGGELRFLGAN